MIVLDAASSSMIKTFLSSIVLFARKYKDGEIEHRQVDESPNTPPDENNLHYNYGHACNAQANSIVMPPFLFTHY
jgi:hypothetical protein